MNTRPRGVMVYPMPKSVSGPFDRYALLVRDDGTEVRMVHTEGVAYAVTDEKPWCWTDYDPSQPTFTVAYLLFAATTVEPVDLADWVRTFGARLESNFGLAYRWATTA